MKMINNKFVVCNILSDMLLIEDNDTVHLKIEEYLVRLPTYRIL